VQADFKLRISSAIFETESVNFKNLTEEGNRCKGIEFHPHYEEKIKTGKKNRTNKQ